MRELEFANEIYCILDKYTENSWEKEPLDMDEVETLIKHLRNDLNLIMVI